MVFVEVKYTPLSLQTTTIRAEKMILCGEHSESEDHYALVDSSHHGVIQVMLSSLVISLKLKTSVRQAGIIDCLSRLTWAYCIGFTIKNILIK